MKKYIANAGASLPERIVVLGCSAGGLAVLQKILPCLSADYPFPILLVQHLPRIRGSRKLDVFQKYSQLEVIEAEINQPIMAGQIILAPPDYHLLVESENELALSVDPPVHYSRPSIDVLFESAAHVYAQRCIGVLLTGANKDGAIGCLAIKRRGGFLLVQQPETAEYPAMPEAALELVEADVVADPLGIGKALNDLGSRHD
ncbi:chemotaxis protein CheB [Balneatrix alpica]|uniref:chemotaxis protein CheB n=1 Tax=Balneatrix alpica TaxID=75684 RepID=UPI0027388165|nr:chemotaxis protein CheB [Balneatrix alpica]